MPEAAAQLVENATEAKIPGGAVKDDKLNKQNLHLCQTIEEGRGIFEICRIAFRRIYLQVGELFSSTPDIWTKLATAKSIHLQFHPVHGPN